MEAPPLPGNQPKNSWAGNTCHIQNFGAFLSFILDYEKEYSGPDSLRNVDFKPSIKAEP